jgi:hypothetical protein
MWAKEYAIQTCRAAVSPNDQFAQIEPRNLTK